MSTYFPGAGEIERKWYVVDAAGQTLGRLATRVASILSGKDSPRFTRSEERRVGKECRL